MDDRTQASAHRIRFCTASDGVRIAYAMGGAGPHLVKTPNWLNNLELDVRSPIWQSWIAQAARDWTLVRYDARGCGLSDRDVPLDDFATNLRDLEAVVRAAGLRRFVLFGASQGAAIAIEYAARYPEQVSHLVLYGAYLQGALQRTASAEAVDEARTMLKLVELGWGRANSAFRQVFANLFIPDGTPEQLRAFDEIQRVTVDPAAAARLLASFYAVDVRELASRVRCPTLVMHSRDDARIPFDEGRRVSQAIAGAEFVPLNSRNHILLPQQRAWHQLFREAREFVQRHPDSSPLSSPGLATLTPAERRVLELLAAGWNNTQIAQRLVIQPKTVRNHINHIFDKLNVADRAQAIVRAREAGLGSANRGM